MDRADPILELYLAARREGNAYEFHMNLRIRFGHKALRDCECSSATEAIEAEKVAKELLFSLGPYSGTLVG